jgi:hypothetical protein
MSIAFETLLPHLSSFLLFSYCSVIMSMSEDRIDRCSIIQALSTPFHRRVCLGLKIENSTAQPTKPLTT